MCFISTMTLTGVDFTTMNIWALAIYMMMVWMWSRGEVRGGEGNEGGDITYALLRRHVTSQAAGSNSALPHASPNAATGLCLCSLLDWQFHGRVGLISVGSVFTNRAKRF
jgi:hypothetical protein